VKQVFQKQNIETIIFNKLIKINNDLSIEGPLGKVSLNLKNSYISHTENTLKLCKNKISTENLALIKHLNIGLVVGFRKKIYQSGIWTVMSRMNSLLKFKLGLSHPTYFKIPQHILFHSKKDGQFRTINLFSISYKLIADLGMKLIKLKPADVYRLNGFRYSLLPIYCITQLATQTTLARDWRATKIKTKIGKRSK
jgi:ribosomal protein L6P/L9E